jgi:hypothetical protein
MTLRLHGNTKGKIHYCGPSAISAVTGVSITWIEETAAFLHNVRNPYGRTRTARGIKGMYEQEVIATLHHLGFDVIQHPLAPRTTFGQWLRKRDGEMRRAKCIVLVTGHYLAVHGLEVFCSNQGPKTEASTRYKRSRVQRVFEVRKRT